MERMEKERKHMRRIFMYVIMEGNFDALREYFGSSK